MRAGEFCNTSTSEFDPTVSLCLEDVAIDSHQNPTSVRVTLKQSKTDPFRQGVSIYMDKTNSDLCPVSAILAYIAIRPQRGGPLFIYRDDTVLTREKLVTHVLAALSSTGLDTRGYSGHSFRIGAATTAALAGVEDVIKILGRWESSAYQRYLWTPRESLTAILAQLVSSVR